MKNVFSVEFPKNWKTNLYYDDIQSSVYAADTTKQLTETTIFDITFIANKISFDNHFKLNQEQKKLAKKLIKVQYKELIFLKKPTYYSIYKGFKNGFLYQILDVFIKKNEKGFVHIKIEIYGDSLVKNRLCNAINIIHTLKLKP